MAWSVKTAEGVTITPPIRESFDYGHQQMHYFDSTGQEIWPDDMMSALNQLAVRPYSEKEDENAIIAAAVRNAQGRTG